MNKAFTLIEMSIVVAVTAILVSITTISLTQLQQHSYLENAVQTLVSDMKHQQLKAMSGNTDGMATHDFNGIFFETDQYTLFRGSTYDPDDPLNFTIVLNPSVEFTNILFPSSLLIFDKGSGEVLGFTENTNSVTLHNIPSGVTKTIVLNQYGVVTSID